MISLNIALIFNDHDAHDIAVYSQKLAPMIASDYIVGVNSIAHITVLQVEMDPDDVRDRMASLKFSPINVTATRAYQNMGSGGLTWHGIEIALTPELSAVQMQIWDALGRPDVHNKVGDQYYPHITTGHGQAVDAADGPAAAPDVTGLIREYPVRVAVGTSGPKYQVERILFSL